MITVLVRVCVPWLPGKYKHILLKNKHTVKELLNHIGIDEKQFGDILVVINGKSKCLEDDLCDGDNVIVLPVLCGG